MVQHSIINLKSIQNNVAKHRRSGRSLNIDKGNCGRGPSSPTDENVERV